MTGDVWFQMGRVNFPLCPDLHRSWLFLDLKSMSFSQSVEVVWTTQVALHYRRMTDGIPCAWVMTKSQFLGMKTGCVDSLKHFVFVLYVFISVLVLLLPRTRSQSLCKAGHIVMLPVSAVQWALGRNGLVWLAITVTLGRNRYPRGWWEVSRIKFILENLLSWRCSLNNGSSTAWVVYLKWTVGCALVIHPSLAPSVLPSPLNCLITPPSTPNQFLNPVSHCIRLFGEKTVLQTVAWQMYCCCYCLFVMWELLIRESDRSGARVEDQRR